MSTADSFPSDTAPAEAGPATGRTARTAAPPDDDATLHQLGYPRRLTRRFELFDNFAISATIINVIAGVFTGFAIGMNAGGPRVLIFGWLLVSVLVLAVGTAMGEIASAYPTSGALYYSAAKLARRHKAAWSWYTGWLNFAGQIGGTAGTDFAAAAFVQTFAAMVWPSYRPTLHQQVLIAAVILLVHALANTYTVRLVALLNRVSVWWLLFGVVILVSALVIVPARHEPASFALSFDNRTGFGWAWYGGAFGLLVTAWTFTGFDASFHMSEETVGAADNAPRGIVNAIRWSGVFGFFLLLALVFASRDWAAQAAAGNPPVRILTDALGAPRARLLLLIVIGALLFCGLANMTSNSRQIFAFSRDGAMPGSRLWYSVSERTRTPVKAVWLAAGCAFVLLLPGYWNTTAFEAIVSVNVIGLFGSYGIPIFLRLRLGAEFRPGPWNKGRRGVPIAALAVVWILLSSVLFMLPESSPITHDSFNYAPIALGAVMLVATIWWFATANRNFHGPVSYGTPEELAAMDLV